MNLNKGVLPVLCGLILFAMPVAPRAELADQLENIKPRIGIEEEYNDNLDLTPTNKRDDFITRVTPGLHYTLGDPTLSLDLDYQLGLVYYARESESNLISHNGTLGAQYALSKKILLRLRDYLVRSDEPRETSYLIGEEGRYLLSTTQERKTYVRNVVEPSLAYRVSKGTLFNLTYRNNIYRSEATGRDSTENAITPSLSFQLTPEHGLSFDYTHTRGTFEDSPSMTGDEITPRYIYRFTPQTTLSVQYLYAQRRFDDPEPDYKIHRPGIGIGHQFTATTSGSARAGYYRQSVEGGVSHDGFSGELGLTTRMQHTTINVRAETGYAEEYFTSTSLGFVRSNRLSAAISHQLQQRLSMRLSGGVEQTKNEADHEEMTWDADANISYQPLKWLTTSLQFSHSDRNSDIDTSDYENNRVILRLTATY